MPVKGEEEGGRGDKGERDSHKYRRGEDRVEREMAPLGGLYLNLACPPATR